MRLRRNEVVLVLQIGSLGDTVIALPCYREIARRHPAAERYLLTNFPIGSKMVPAESILLPTGVIRGSIEYPMPLRSLRKTIALWYRIATLRPSILYYLLPETRLINLLRHCAFFKLCGIRTIRGIPWSRDLRYPRELQRSLLWESEASRLLRTIGVPAGPPADMDRDLALSDAERSKADAIIREMDGVTGFLAVSVGGKVPVNDWGDENWRAVLSALSAANPRLGAVFVGSADERPRNEALATAWQGRIVNTCGDLTPRETAALIARAIVFVCHDTGTLHLGAAVNTPLVGIFSARNRAGKWFSDRPRDAFFYHHVSCAGCECVQRAECPNDVACMASHDRHSVVAAVQDALVA